MNFSGTCIVLPIVGSDNSLNDLLLRYAEEALADRPQERASLRSAVGRVLPQLLPHAKANASNVSQKLALSTRTLSRKLRDEDVAFAEILEETRAALAKRYLAECDMPISEIAWLLGYGRGLLFHPRIQALDRYRRRANSV